MSETRLIVMQSGLIAFRIDKELAEEINKYVKENYSEIADIPQYEQIEWISGDRRAGKKYYLVKLLPTHWLYVWYSWNVPERNFGGRWIKNEEAEKKLSEEKWTRVYYFLTSALAVEMFGCTGDRKLLPRPQ
jgi:hypothetical protein